MVRVGGSIQAHYNAEGTDTPWLTGWHNATVLCVNNKSEITISFDEYPTWGKFLIPTKQTRSRDKAPISAVSVPKSNATVSQAAEDPVVTKQIPQPIAVQSVPPVAQGTGSLLVKEIPVCLILGGKKKCRNFPRSIPENELSKLVLKVFRDLKEQDYYLEYAEDICVESEDDWESAVEYFDLQKPDRLELRVIIEQKEVPVSAELAILAAEAQEFYKERCVPACLILGDMRKPRYLNRYPKYEDTISLDVREAFRDLQTQWKTGMRVQMNNKKDSARCGCLGTIVDFLRPVTLDNEETPILIFATRLKPDDSKSEHPNPFTKGKRVELCNQTFSCYNGELGTVPDDWQAVKLDNGEVRAFHEKWLKDPNNPKDFYLTYGKDLRVEVDEREDWRAAVRYFDQSNSDLLELRIILKKQ